MSFDRMSRFVPARREEPWLILIALAVGLAGCAESKPPAAPAAAPPVAIAPPPARAPAPAKSATTTIFLSERLKSACGEANIETTASAPKFAFDQSALLSEDRSTLEHVARCLTTGPLKGKTVKLTGRADPRGSASYNMALGERRAASVEHYLGQLGVSAAQMTETSRGAIDAQGDNEAEWARDRRVDLDISAP